MGSAECAMCSSWWSSNLVATWSSASTLVDVDYRVIDVLTIFMN